MGFRDWVEAFRIKFQGLGFRMLKGLGFATLQASGSWDLWVTCQRLSPRLRFVYSTDSIFYTLKKAYWRLADRPGLP